MRPRGDFNPNTGEPEWRSKEWHFVWLPARRRTLVDGFGCLAVIIIAIAILFGWGAR
jgi:hypothetical protein